MEYRVIRTGQSDDHFEHALFGGGRQKGAQNKNHKYLARAWIQNKWRYAYTQAEVAMLQNWGKGKDGGLADQKKLNDAKRNAKEAKKQMEKTDKAMAKAVDTAKNKTGEAVYKAKKTAQETASNVAKTAKEKANDVKTGVAAQQVGIKAKNAVENLKEDLPKAAKSAANKASETAKKASESISKFASNAMDKGKEAIDKTSKKISDTKQAYEDLKDYSSKVDKKKQQAVDAMKEHSRLAKFNKDRVEESHRMSDERALAGNKSDAIAWENEADLRNKYVKEERAAVENAKEKYREAVKEEKSDRYKMSDLLSNGIKSQTYKEGKAKVEELMNKAYDKATDQVEKVRESDAMATASKAVEKAKDKASDAAERVADRASDAAASAKHVAEAAKARAKYGADSLQYNQAKALIEHDRATEALRKARDKYGVNSPEYKQAAEKERAAMSRYEDAREENLYTNNKQYRETSNQASAIGSRIDAIDANGGPKTPEGRATYQRLLRELNSLESKLDSLRR